MDLPSAFGEEDWDFELGDRAAWFSFFGDSELSGLIDRAFESNPSLNAARARLRQADARARQAGSALWPTVSASFDGERSHAPLPAGGIGGGGAGSQRPESQTIDSYRASLAASYEVDLWGRIRDRRQAAALSAESAEDAMLAASMTLAARLSEAWLDVIHSRQRLKVIEDQVDLSRDLLALTEERLAKGQGAAVEVSRQEQQFKSVLELHEREKARLVSAKAQVSILTGAAPQEDVVTVEASDFPRVPAVPDPGVPAAIVFRRPDLRASLNRLRSQEAQVAASMAERFPSLQLQASVFGQSRELGNVFDEIFWRLAASIGEELFDGGREAARIEEQEALADERFYDFYDALLRALTEVETTASQYQQQRVALELINEQLDSACQAVKLANLAYARGEASYLQALDAVRSLQQVQLSQLATRRRVLTLYIQLCRALGGSWSDGTAPHIRRNENG